MTRSTAWCILLTAALGLPGVACGKGDERQLPPTTLTNPSPPVPVLVSVALTGNVQLSAVGESSQLTLTATYNDGTTKDVSRETRWSAADPRVLTIAPDGLVTITSLGRTFVYAGYSNKTAFTKVTATPPGTFVISGRVREPGQGGVPNATIVDRTTGLAAVANADGLFSLAAIPAPQTRVAVTRENYEPREIEANAASDLDAPIQRIVRLTAGESVEPAPLAPNDLAYDIDGVRCQPCRMIRIVVPTTGDMQMVLTWQMPPRLTLFAEGMKVTGDSGHAEGFLTIATPRELVVYVGADTAADHEKFKLTTTQP